MDLTREGCCRLDEADPLKHFRARFAIADGLIYLDGNSLGPVCSESRSAVLKTLDMEWGRDLIGSWNTAGWVEWPERLGDRIGTLIGAAPGQTVVADGTSINLFKALIAAFGINPGRKVMVSAQDNFPSDLYITEGARALLAGVERRLAPAGADEEAIIGLLDEDVAVLTLTHVNYRTARVFDLDRLTREARRKGIVVIWDLAHSAGAVPVGLDRAGADFAVGCGYKYLNGGPGAPGFIYVAERHHGRAVNPLTGWLGHARPFDFAPSYQPAGGIRSFVCGTPQILSHAGLKGALDLFDATAIETLYAKAQSLTSLFIALVESRCRDAGFTLISPRDPALRGSHVSFAHDHAFAVVQALIARNVIGDFRAPDVARFGFAPLYNSHVEVWDAVDHLVDIAARAEWHEPRFNRKKAVT